MQTTFQTTGAMRSSNSFRKSNVSALKQQSVARVPRSRSVGLIVRAHPQGPPSAYSTPKTFLDELRSYSMRLHTREQAREGQAAAPKEQKPWQPTKEGYLRFLIESKAVYEAFEDIMANSSNTDYRIFTNTGLERTAALGKDIDYMVNKWGLKADPPANGGPGLKYAAFLRDLSERSPPAFLCHYYNFYFAHTAGGRMIGAQLSKMCLDMWMGDFYKWDGEVSDLVNGVRDKINTFTEKWSRDDKDSCLRETARTFSYSGGLLKELTGGSGGGH